MSRSLSIPAVPSSQVSTVLIVGLALMSLLWYAMFLFSGAYIEHPIVFTLLASAELIGMVELAGIWLTIMVGRNRSEPPEAMAIRRKLLRVDPKRVPEDLVACFVTVVDEPLPVLQRTVVAVRDMDIPHRTFILDDGPSDRVRALAEELHVGYFRRESRKGRKAGNVNHALRHVHTRFFAIFDADHKPDRRFLTETLPILLSDERMAFVQTPQYYGNREGLIATGAAELHEAFYRHVQVAKNACDSAFCVGTNVLFRTEAVSQIGGIYEGSNSEDIWTSILLHERGWKSFFVPTVLAIGRGPETVGDFLRQQFRWARGGLEILFQHHPFLQKTLTVDQRWQYVVASMHYLSGVSVLIFFLLPLLFAYAGLKPLQTLWPVAWVLHFVPYLLMMFLTSAYLLGRFPRWSTYVVALCAFPAHLAALISVLTGFDMQWSVTGVIRKQSDYISAVAPQMLLLLFSVAAIPLVFLRERDLSVSIIVAFWLAFSSALLFSFCREAFPGWQKTQEKRGVSVPSLSELAQV